MAQSSAGRAYRRNSSDSFAIFAAIRKRLVFGEQLGRRSPTPLILEIDIRSPTF
jgi:hypothetical protein